MSKKFAIIENGKVVNIVLADNPIESNWIETEIASIGDIYADGVFSSAPVDLDFMSRLARAKRTAELLNTDWTQLADSPVDDLAWASYRQALRDIPQQPGFPENIIWPVPPS